jgi:LDH2 family malate/lactate/ureidoglycolate dehydrogenase
MRINLNELNKQVNEYLSNIGLNEADAATLTELVIEQEMVGNQFSAVGELSGKHSRLFEDMKISKEEVVVTKPALKLIKGNGRFAPIITAEYIDSVIAAAKNQGIYALGIYDSTYNDFFDVFCRRIAEKDCISIIVENGGPRV